VSRTQLIRASKIVAYDGEDHALLENGVIVVQGPHITYVGPEYEGSYDDYIAAEDCLVVPGMINAHCHVTTPATRSFQENCGNPHFHMSGLYEALPISWEMRPEQAAVVAEATLIELLRTGSTTAVVLGTYATDQGRKEGLPEPSILERVAEIAQRLGIRLYLSPGYKSARWRVVEGRDIAYDWDEAAGRKGLARNKALIRSVDGTGDGLVNFFLGPLQVDTCSRELLQETARVAEELGCHVQIHAGQALREFQEIVRREGKTPFEFLCDVGLLGPSTSIAHGIFVAGHSWTATPPQRDLDLLVETETSIAHCPNVFARSGVALESYARYLKAGANVGIGTDTFPQDIIQEMRMAALISKVVDRDSRVATAADVFRSATLAGARMLGRHDLGRIAPGALADLVFLDLRRVSMNSARDPLKTLVYSGSGGDVKRVMVNGKIVVENGQVCGADEAEIARALDETTRSLWERLPAVDWAERNIDQFSPMSISPWQTDGHEAGQDDNGA
jgi:5-methylthioadenosine/S-adenosylhomocysteine deaminase